jgi:hypothetical protein
MINIHYVLSIHLYMFYSKFKYFKILYKLIYENLILSILALKFLYKILFNNSLLINYIKWNTFYIFNI